MQSDNSTSAPWNPAASLAADRRIIEVEECTAPPAAPDLPALARAANATPEMRQLRRDLSWQLAEAAVIVSKTALLAMRLRDADPHGYWWRHLDGLADSLLTASLDVTHE